MKRPPKNDREWLALEAREARRPRPPGLGALHGTIAPRESVNNELTDLKP